MFDFLTDEEIMEGFFGAIAFAIMIWYFRSYLKWSRTKSAGIIFPLTWIIRKGGMNIYKYLKDKRGLSLKTIKTKLF